MRIQYYFQYNRQQMHTFIAVIISGGIAFAQTAPATKPPAPKPAPPKTAGAKVAKGVQPRLGPTPAQAAKLMHPQALKATAPATYKVKFTTAKDQTFVVDIHRDWAPNGADRFYNLAKNGFFNGVRFYRVSPGFVVQFGVNADPKITQAWAPARIQDDPVKEHNTKGRLTFAMGGPNSRTTQLFFNLKDNTRLDDMGFAPIGEVSEGMDVVEGLFSGYGEIREQGGNGPEQMRVMMEGEKYLKASFDNLDIVKSAVVIEPPGSAPPKPASAKPAVRKAAAPTKK
jgi:peptidyl-prolyl cis-trans isomerase A (cyclophilin A)